MNAIDVTGFPNTIKHCNGAKLRLQWIKDHDADNLNHASTQMILQADRKRQKFAAVLYRGDLLGLYQE